MPAPPLHLDVPRDLGQLIRATLTVWRENAGCFLALSAGVVITVELIAAIGLGEVAGPYQSTVALRRELIDYAIFTLVTTPLISAMQTGAVLELAQGRRPTVARSAQAGLDVFAPVLWVVLLYWALVLAGLSLLILPGIYVAVSGYVCVQAAVAERARGLRAIARSTELVAGSWWRMLGIVLVISLMIGLPKNVLIVAFAQLAHALDARAVELVGRMALDTVGVSIQAVAGVLLFCDLRARRQGPQSAHIPGPG